MLLVQSWPYTCSPYLFAAGKSFPTRLPHFFLGFNLVLLLYALPDCYNSLSLKKPCPQGEGKNLLTTIHRPKRRLLWAVLPISTALLPSSSSLRLGFFSQVSLLVLAEISAWFWEWVALVQEWFALQPISSTVRRGRCYGFELPWEDLAGKPLLPPFLRFGTARNIYMLTSHFYFLACWTVGMDGAGGKPIPLLWTGFLFCLYQFVSFFSARLELSYVWFLQSVLSCVVNVLLLFDFWLNRGCNRWGLGAGSRRLLQTG